MLWASVIFALALGPLFLINGLAGDSFYPPMAGAALLAVVASLLTAMTVAPALGLLLSRKQPLRRESPVTRGITRAYTAVFAPVVRTPIPAFVAMGVLVIGAAFVVPTFTKSLLPNLHDTNLLVKWDGPHGTSLPEMDRITQRAATELRALPGVKDVGAQVGQASLGDAPVGSDSAEMWISIDPSANYGKTVKAIKGVVAGYPGFHHEVTTYTKNRMTDVLSPTKDQITVRVFGNDSLDTLQKTAEEVRKTVEGTDGVVSAHIASPPTEPTMEVEVDLAKAKVLGIKPGDVRRAAATMLSGLRVGSLFEDQKVFDVVVWSTPDTRSSLSGVQDLLIDTPDGGHVRLGDVATVRVRATPPVIEHRDISRFVDVTANVNGRNVGKVADRVKERLATVSYPVEYHAELLGGLLPRAGRAAAHARLRPRGRRSASSCCSRPRSRAGGSAPSPSGRWSSPSRVACSPRGSTAVRSPWPPSPGCSPCSASRCARAWPCSTGTADCAPKRAWRSAPTWSRAGRRSG